MIPKFERSFDQYSYLAIRLNIFLFSAINSKTNLKFEKSFPLVYRACQDESNDIGIRKTLNFDRYWRFAIRLEIFWFSGKN